jgi:hypothetical protein
MFAERGLQMHFHGLARKQAMGVDGGQSKENILEKGIYPC